jgi:hypothetical protein
MSARAAAVAVLACLLASAGAGCFGAANAAPNITSRVTPQLVAVGVEVTYSGTAVDSDGSVVSFAWDFGDGSTPFTNATRGATVHTYAKPGNYTAVFRACDNQGACPEARHNVSVVAIFTITVDWSQGHNGYVIKGPATLDAALVRVTIAPDGRPPLENASVGAGLTMEGNTTYRGHLGPETIERYKSTQVRVYYNGTVAATRSVVAQPFQGSSTEPSLRYDVGQLEERPFAGVNSSWQYGGNETWTTVGLGVSHQFEGEGLSNIRTESAGTVAWTNASYSNLTWTEQWSRSDSALAPSAFGWSGSGTLDAVGPTGFRTFLNLTNMTGAEASGNVTSLSADGDGYYIGEVGGSFGNATYRQRSNGTLGALDGSGVTRDALRIEETSTLNGTYGGVAFSNANISARLTARSDGFLRPDFWTAWNTTSRLANTTTTDSGARYLDADANGVPDPVPMPPLASSVRNFEGLVPSVLVLGDLFVVSGGAGASAVLDVLSVNTDILVAQGLPVVGIPVATLAGGFGDPNDTSVLAGVLNVAVVAEGPLAGMWISGSTRLYKDDQRFIRTFELIAKA